MDDIQERRDRVARLTREGWTAQQIAWELGVSTRTVSRHRVAAGVGGPPGRPVTDEEIDAVCALRIGGASWAEVARVLGRDKKMIWRAFQAAKRKERAE